MAVNSSIQLFDERKCDYKIKERTVYDNTLHIEVVLNRYSSPQRIIRFHLPHRMYINKHSFSGSGSIKKAGHYPNL